MKSIEDVSNFINQIKKIGNKTGFSNYFRGHPDAEFKLEPSIYRDNYILNEENFFKEAIVRIPQEFASYKTTIEKLVKMQHYGVPTRLLDITSNPLVALFFACNKDLEKDGEVIFLQIPENYIRFYDSDRVSIISNISKRSVDFEINYSPAVSIFEFNKSYHIGFLLHEIKEEKPYFQDIIDFNDLEKVYAVKVKYDNPRILKQSGAFLLFGIYANKRTQANVPTDWLLNKTNKHLNLIIKADKKREILNELDLLGINDSTLFPELENQAKYLRELFKK